MLSKAIRVQNKSLLKAAVSHSFFFFCLSPATVPDPSCLCLAVCCLLWTIINPLQPNNFP